MLSLKHNNYVHYVSDHRYSIAVKAVLTLFVELMSIRFVCRMARAVSK